MSVLARGLVAGATGTMALDALTYLDIALRGRPPSTVPEEGVARMAERAGIPLGSDEERAANRRTGIGALMGYATGITAGLVFAAVRPHARAVPRGVAALAVAAGTMAATNAGNVSLGTTDPREWSLPDWLSDAVPHAGFGLALVAAHDALDR